MAKRFNGSARDSGWRAAPGLGGGGRRFLRLATGRQTPRAVELDDRPRQLGPRREDAGHPPRHHVQETDRPARHPDRGRRIPVPGRCPRRHRQTGSGDCLAFDLCAAEPIAAWPAAAGRRQPGGRSVHFRFRKHAQGRAALAPQSDFEHTCVADRFAGESRRRVAGLPAAISQFRTLGQRPGPDPRRHSRGPLSRPDGRGRPGTHRGHLQDDDRGHHAHISQLYVRLGQARRSCLAADHCHRRGEMPRHPVRAGQTDDSQRVHPGGLRHHGVLAGRGRQPAGKNQAGNGRAAGGRRGSMRCRSRFAPAPCRAGRPACCWSAGRRFSMAI